MINIIYLINNSSGLPAWGGAGRGVPAVGVHVRGAGGRAAQAHAVRGARQHARLGGALQHLAHHAEARDARARLAAHTTLRCRTPHQNI